MSVMLAFAWNPRVNTEGIATTAGCFKDLKYITFRHAFLGQEIFEKLQGLHSLVIFFAKVVPDVSQYRNLRPVDGVAPVHGLEIDIWVGGSAFSKVVFGVQDYCTFKERSVKASGGCVGCSGYAEKNQPANDGREDSQEVRQEAEKER